MQQYADIYLLQVYSTCFGRPSRPSSGVQISETAASGTGHVTVQQPTSNVAYLGHFGGRSLQRYVI